MPDKADAKVGPSVPPGTAARGMPDKADTKNNEDACANADGHGGKDRHVNNGRQKDFVMR